MLIQKKQFLAGMLIGLFPVLLYANFKLCLTEILSPKNDVAIYNPRRTLSEQNILYTQTVTPTASYQLVSFIQYSFEKDYEPNKVPSPTPTTPPSPKPTKVIRIELPESDFDALIDRYAIQSKVDSRVMKIIAKCESGFRPDAVNGPYVGMYQFITSTWISNRTAMGEDPNPELRFNAEESIKTAAYKMARDGYSAWPACSRIAFHQLRDK